MQPQQGPTMGSQVSLLPQRALPQIKCAFPASNMLLGSPWELGQCRSETVNEQKTEEQAGARAKQGMVFAARGFGRGDVEGLCWKPTLQTGDGKQLPPHRPGMAQLCQVRPVLAQLQMNIAHPTLLSWGMPSKVPPSCSSKPQILRVGLSPTAPCTPG